MMTKLDYNNIEEHNHGQERGGRSNVGYDDMDPKTNSLKFSKNTSTIGVVGQCYDHFTRKSIGTL